MMPLTLLVITLCCLMCVSNVPNVVTTTFGNCSNPSSNKTFMYFAYGSNLWSKRILIENPTAKRKIIGKLKNYRLDFDSFSTKWNGSPATVAEANGSDVWGAIWEIDISNMGNLDRQELVDKNIYKALWKSIETPTGDKVTCRLYQLVNNQFHYLPFDRRPSRTYLKCIINGAEESQLPNDYINMLKRIPHNYREANNSTFRQYCEK